jgi:hypothetical protein
MMSAAMTEATAASLALDSAGRSAAAAFLSFPFLSWQKAATAAAGR